MEVLLPHISRWFLEKQEHFAVFAQADSRIEGWFKAELLVLFNRLVASQVLEKFEREANVISPKDGKRKQVDLGFKFKGKHTFAN
jgi:hypothetical protein